MNTETFNYMKNEALFERAKEVIPNGIAGHFNPAVQKPAGTYPFYAAKAKGAHFWDIDGNKYIDYMCAYGPMILGYANQVVDDAFRSQLVNTDTCTLASPVMVELAEFLVDLVPMADWASFAKNGADATNMAVLIARVATGRSKVIAIEDGYHGASPWMQSIERAGITSNDHSNVIRIPWNDTLALEQALTENSNEVAAFISSPYHHPAYKDNELPHDNYWQKVQAILTGHGVVSILDDVRAGFRIDMAGSNRYFNFEPDMICFCKAIANGYPISALVGTDSLKEAAGAIFQTGSFWFSAAPMAAALACLKELQRTNAPVSIMAKGKKVTDGLIKIAAQHGHELRVTGMPSMPYLRTEHEIGIEFHQALCGECTRRGVFLASHHNLFISAALSDEDMQQTWNIFEEALSVVSERFGNRG